MEGCPRNGESCPKLLDLIPEDTEWSLGRESNEKRRHECGPLEKKLELRLGPPGCDEDSPMKNSGFRSNINKMQDQSLLSLGSFSSQKTEKPFSPPCALNAAVPHRSQERTALGAVVGWPPIRSLRKNLASTSSSKPGAESANAVQNKVVVEKPKTKVHFVKINMDGVPIGRKVDLNAYDSYEKLSSAVVELFRGLLVVQRNSSIVGSKQEARKPIAGLLEAQKEYTLVYEDNEGDKMLVGDVPWHMFVSSVKRLRVLKSSDLSSVLLGSSKQAMKTT